MVRKILKNKPLVEAIFELRWGLQESENEVKIDPHYKILIGSMYDKVKKKYPFHEQLPTASIPDEIAGYVVQHRFRKGEDEWPLIQIGPGVITLNYTEGYDWGDFEKMIVYALDALFKAYPDAENNLKIDGLLLRYINAIDFDYEKEDILDFLKGKMKTAIRMDKKLFKNSGVNKLPLAVDLRFSFPSTKPKGAVYLRFARGKRKDTDTLTWETRVHSTGEDVPKAIDKIPRWVNDAHKLTDDWFFKMVKGELLKKFE